MWNSSVLSPKNLSPLVATIMIALSTIGFGSIPFFAKAMSHAGLASSAVAFYRYLLGAILLLPFLNLSLKQKSPTFWAISAGVASGLGWMAYVEALQSVPVATVGVIYMTYPLFTLLIAMLWWRKLPQRRSIFAALLVVVAALIALSPASVGLSSIKPLIFSFFAPLTFGYAVVILSDKVTSLTPVERIAGFSLGGTLGLFPPALSLHSSLLIPSRLVDWLLVLGIAIVSALLPQLLYAMAAPFIGSARAAIVGSFELPVMFVVGWLAFGEQITLLQSVAALLVLIAIWMTNANPSEELSQELEVKKMMPSS